MKKYLIASSTAYVEILGKRDFFIKKNFNFINKKKYLTLKKLRKIKPKYIFFPHWRHKIDSSIYVNYQCIGFHSTPLPYGRGGSPIQNMIARGFKKTKICAIKITEKIDEGPIFIKRNMSLNGSGEQIMLRMNNIILKMIKFYVKKPPKEKKQTGMATYFKRRNHKQSKISFGKRVDQIYDHIRMLDIQGYPRTFIEKEKYKIIFKNPVKTGNTIKCLSIIEKKEIS